MFTCYVCYSVLVCVNPLIAKNVVIFGLQRAVCIAKVLNAMLQSVLVILIPLGRGIHRY